MHNGDDGSIDVDAFGFEDVYIPIPSTESSSGPECGRPVHVRGRTICLPDSAGANGFAQHELVVRVNFRATLELGCGGVIVNRGTGRSSVTGIARVQASEGNSGILSTRHGSGRRHVHGAVNISLGTRQSDGTGTARGHLFSLHSGGSSTRRGSLPCDCGVTRGRGRICAVSEGRGCGFIGVVGEGRGPVWKILIGALWITKLGGGTRADQEGARAGDGNEWVMSADCYGPCFKTVFYALQSSPRMETFFAEF